MDTLVLERFESFIKEHFQEVLQVSPMDSLTPFRVGNTENTREEFIFIAKLSPYMYEPFKGRNIRDPLSYEMLMYHEDETLIVGFKMLGVLTETEIRPELISEFLTVLYSQEKITIAVVDGDTYRLVWLTNTIPFGEMRSQYQKIFTQYGIGTN